MVVENRDFSGAVYANPQETQKKILWEKLKVIAASMLESCLLEGDFNDIANSTEKRGGLQASQSRCNMFRNKIQSCKLDDLETRGPMFTWRGPYFHGGQRIYEKFDCVLSNDRWICSYLNAYVKVLARVEFSDHHSILIVPTIIVNARKEKPFRFENAWLLKETYHDMIKQVWNNEDNFLQNISNTSEGIKEWKYETFDEVRRRKEKLCVG
ncbi:uncharacterized protein LOC131598639 [Vicia villosa]|uniref:uncharacterized protein LOC131598639 n=1 Tax=Vicia villosa TaxID=3911 RepID=UPI00273A9966|nr:uncharacterized protein LOC131598639 [Vicia villosa]